MDACSRGELLRRRKYRAECKDEQEAQLSQRGRATPHVVKNCVKKFSLFCTVSEILNVE